MLRNMSILINFREVPYKGPSKKPFNKKNFETYHFGTFEQKSVTSQYGDHNKRYIHSWAFQGLRSPIVQVRGHSQTTLEIFWTFLTPPPLNVNVVCL